MPDGVSCQHRVFKAVHGLLQTLAGGFIILGTVFAIVYKLPSNNRHFWSVHAWIGAGAIALYCLQYPLGAHTPPTRAQHL